MENTTKRYDGKIYRLAGRYYAKGKAKKFAERSREGGYYARVVKTGKIYEVYLRFHKVP